MTDLHQNINIRYRFTLYSQIWLALKGSTEYKSKLVLAEFFLKCRKKLMISEIVEKTRAFKTQINYIQRKLKDKLATQHAKQEVVKMHWDRVLFSLVKIAHENHDQGMLNICRSIAECPSNLINELIKRYVKKCKEKHAVAFMQWRLHFRKDVAKQEELTEII